MTKLAHHRALVVSPARGCGDLAGEARRLREEAQSRYSEVDLLVAAMRDHIRDLQAERDRLLAELDAIRARTALEATPWLWRGMKPAR